MIKNSNKLKFNFYSFFSYGFLHFNSEESKNKFFDFVKGKKFSLGSEKNIVIKFLPIKRSKQVRYKQ